MQIIKDGQKNKMSEENSYLDRAGRRAVMIDPNQMGYKSAHNTKDTAKQAMQLGLSEDEYIALLN